ncbi:MAG: hypothetical protein MJY70_06555 [Bacteroidales bacterium]|nr:hypothetical protein [Bacteroidales bacterium]
MANIPVSDSEEMSRYALLCELNRKEQFGEAVTDSEKAEAVERFLAGVRPPEEIRAYRRRMRVEPDTDRMYPDFFLPPENGGKKLRLAQGYLPKTAILYANAYEAEILRLLVRYAPENPAVREPVERTLDRFEHTCFGNSCEKGECAAAGIAVLRLLAAAAPAAPPDTARIDRLLDPLGERFLAFGPGQAASQKDIPLSYLLMAFTDLNSEKTRALIRAKKDWLADLLRRPWITGRLSNGNISEGDTYNLLGKYILRGALCTLPEYPNRDHYPITVDEADGRCRCDFPG